MLKPEAAVFLQVFFVVVGVLLAQVGLFVFRVAFWIRFVLRLALH